MEEKPSNISNRSKSDNNPKKFKLSGVIVLTVLVVCVVVFAAKGLFKSNGTDIPADVYTGTINTAQTTTTTKVTEAANATKKADSKNDESASDDGKTDSKTDDSKAEDESKADESNAADSSESDESIPADGEKAYVNQYANLHTEPSKDSENIVCMSPNIEVTVLEKLDNDYWKVYFVNVDGPKTGYVWSGYLNTES